MARRGGRYHGRGKMGKAARKYFSLFGKVIGGVIIAGPAINVVVQKLPGGNDVGKWNTTGADMLYAYTGIGSDGTVNVSQTAVGAGSIIGGVVVMKIFSWVAKRF